MDAHDKAAVMVHGAGGGGWEWTVWARVFAARGWRVLAPDLRAASGGIVATTFDDYLAQVRQWCATPPDLLIGASLGGLLALAVAADVGAKALVLINPLPPRALAPPLGRARPYPPRVAWGRERSLDGTQRAMPDADDAACLHAFRRWRDESGAVLNAAIGGIAVATPACPVYVIASENDDDVPMQTTLALGKALSAHTQVLRDISHVGPLLGRSAALVAEHVARWSASAHERSGCPAQFLQRD